MRFKYSSRTPQTSVIDMTPMIDIVFNLLLFFLLSTSYVQHSAIQIALPIASTAKAMENEVVVLDLTEDQRIYLNEIKIEGMDILRVEMGRIYSDSEALERRPLLVRADAQARHEHVVALLDFVRDIGVKSYFVATLPSASK